MERPPRTPLNLRGDYSSRALEFRALVEFFAQGGDVARDKVSCERQKNETDEPGTRADIKDRFFQGELHRDEPGERRRRGGAELLAKTEKGMRCTAYFGERDII